MGQPGNQQLIARQVERIVRQLTSLSTLPTVAANVLSQMSDETFDPVQFAEHIQSDAALTAKVLTLAHREGVAFDAAPTVTEAVAKLDVSLLREAVISVKVIQVLDVDEDADGRRALPRRQMALHSLAVACCAGRLAELVLDPDQRQTAYLAGLLHDIGKCALDEVMPKSFERMVEEARAEQASLVPIEQKHLGLDHTVLGKRLAQKWFLPEPVTAAIWLHHCDGPTLSADLPHARIAQIVALADRLARQVQIGAAGSCDKPDGIEEIASLLSITPMQIEEVTQTLGELVHEKAAMLGLEDASGGAGYYTMIQKTAADLAKDNRQLNTSSGGNVHLTAQVSLIKDFLEELDENSAAMDIAEAFAVGWKQHTQCGLTAVYVAPNAAEPYVELVAVDRKGRTEIKSLNMPDGMPSIPEAFRTNESILPAADGARWVCEQCAGDFNPELLYMAPLRMGDEVAAVLVFEVYSKDDELLGSEHAMLSCRVAAAAIMMALAGAKQQELAERFVGLMSTLRQTRTELARRESMEGLAEMAAGAAHELNNPLAVISGRAQILLDEEEDKDKKKMLRQIQRRTNEIARIVEDLMLFARPNDPEKKAVSVNELIVKAMTKVAKACKLQSLDAVLDGADVAGSVYVDAHQVGLALESILTNSQQAYKDDSGPVWIDCSVSGDGSGVVVAIRDEGCGMDAQALEKATQPFYSSYPAGRRRGMGLAQTQRLLTLNGGDLKLVSAPGEGTTVTVTLPKV